MKNEIQTNENAPRLTLNVRMHLVLGRQVKNWLFWCPRGQWWWIRGLNPGDLTSYNNVLMAIQLRSDKGNGFCTLKALLRVSWSAVHTDSRAPTLRSRPGLRVSISTISHKLPGTSLSTAGPQPASAQPCALVSGQWHCPMPVLGYCKKPSKRTKSKSVILFSLNVAGNHCTKNECKKNVNFC